MPGTLSGIPIWKTTKQSSFDHSVLQLLGDSDDANFQQLAESELAEIDDNAGGALANSNVEPNRRARRRLSTPVMALQTPIVVAQSQQDANKLKRISVPDMSFGQPTNPKVHGVAGPSAAAELQRVLIRS